MNRKQQAKKQKITFEEFQIKHNLTDSEMEYYVERIGIMTADNDVTAKEAHAYTMQKIKEMRQ